MTTTVVPSGLARVLDRADQIRARMRELDPTWRGVDLWPRGAATTSSAPASLEAGGRVPLGVAPEGFAAAMAAASVDAASARASSITSPSSTLGWSDGRFVMPVSGARTTQGFGPTEVSPFHDGLDLAAPLGQAVVAAAAGRVLFAGRVDDGAVVVRIAHDDGSETQYGHLGVDLKVRAGDRVAAGDQIGEIGLTGKTTGPHLHFELWRDGRAIDPAPWIAAGRSPESTASATDLAADPGQPADRAAALARFDLVAERIPYAPEIRGAAAEAGIDPLLLAALVRAESNFRPGAVSRAGAMGLTQLMPATARGLQVDDPFDPAQNLRGGATYLAGNLRIYGRVDLALAAYQAGKGAVKAAGGIPDSPTTRGYIAAVLDTWAGYLEVNR